MSVNLSVPELTMPIEVLLRDFLLNMPVRRYLDLSSANATTIIGNLLIQW
ncbi:MAG: hypothetical protein VX693_06440 [Pseudomonadota bacterium]|nr:hypothetical protein [Pseudomonadota bacterium]